MKKLTKSEQENLKKSIKISNLENTLIDKIRLNVHNYLNEVILALEGVERTHKTIIRNGKYINVRKR